MLAVSKKANKRHNMFALLLCAVVIAAAIYLVGCTPSPSQMMSEQETEYKSFDEAPWDLEFNVDHVYNTDDTYIYFYKDTVYNNTTHGITMYKVRKDLAFKTIDKRGEYYITKSCLVSHESSSIVRPALK